MRCYPKFPYKRVTSRYEHTYRFDEEAVKDLESARACFENGLDKAAESVFRAMHTAAVSVSVQIAGTDEKGDDFPEIH